jgi:AcrR family transcriptional regulator
MAKRNYATDLNRVDRLYRAGLLSVREIARECNVPEPNIRYHAKTRGWKRDLTDEMRQRTKTKLVENLAKVFSGNEVVDKLKQVTDEEIIEEASKTQVEVVRQHQATLGSGHSLTMRMLNELDASTTHRGELEQMIRSEVAVERQTALFKAVSLPQRAAVMRDLATAARLWVTLERQAFNIADDRDKDSKDRKLDEMTAEQLRAEIQDDAKKLGLELTSQDFGVVPRTTNGSGKPH